MRRRHFLAAGALLPPLLSSGARVVSAAPPPEPITPALVDAASKEGKVTYYTAMDLSVAEPMAKAFEAKYPAIKVAVERSGAERVFNRIGQEMASKIYRVDVANSSDAAHFIVWKREGWLAPFVSQDMARDLATEMIDADGAFCNQRTHLSTIAYNSKMIAPADAPRGFMDLLDPKYSGKLVKGHPGYSGTIMTATQQLARELGWSYFEKLAKQKVLQVQSATEPPKRIVAGERAIAVVAVEQHLQCVAEGVLSVGCEGALDANAKLVVIAPVRIHLRQQRGLAPRKMQIRRRLEGRVNAHLHRAPVRAVAAGLWRH